MPNNLIEATDANFNELFEKHPFLVMDFWAPWCGPCVAFAPIFEEIAAEFPDITFAKINVDKETHLAKEFNVRSIPFVVIMREHVALFSESGSLPKDALRDLLTQAQGVDMAKVHQDLAEQHDKPN